MLTSQSKNTPWWYKLSQWLSQNLTNQHSFAAFFEPLIQWFLPQWRASAYRAKIVEVREEIDTVYTLVIRPMGSWPMFKAGQFVELMVDYQGSLVSRYFSVSSAPNHYQRNQTIELTIKVQPHGKITPWLPTQLAQGGVVNIQNAIGEFVQDSLDKPALFIAGGSGITPFRSMLHEAAAFSDKSALSDKPALNASKTPSQSADITLMYYAKNEQQFLFINEFKRLEKLYPRLKLHLIATNQQGRICERHLQDYCPDFQQRKVYICGPSSMIQSAQQLLEQHQLPTDQIVSEYFGATSPTPIVKDIDSALLIGTDALASEALNSGSLNSKVLFERSNKSVDLNRETHTPTNLLDVAENQNLNPISGCRMGVCHQCICRKKSGVVFNTKTQTYSDTGAQEIQLCVSVAVGNVVLDL